jgi:glycosyltransferase involved in cell wall biosynthesis
LRVLQVMASGLHGGAELFFEDLVPALARAGLTQRAVIRPYPSRAAKLAAAGVTSRMLRFGGPFDLATPWRLRREALAWRPDIVLGWMNRACASLPRGPWINVGRLGGYYDLKYYRRCPVLICNTPDIADHVVRAGRDPRAVHYIPNFCTVADDPPVRRETLDTPEGVPVLLVLARLQPSKAIDVAMRALAAIPDAVLWIAGDGPLERALPRLAEDLGVAARVRFLGWRDDRSALLKAANVVLVPSRHEPFGNVVVNAWAHGVPLVATRSEGPRFLVRDGEDGLLVPVDDAVALAGAVRRVLADRGLADRLAAGGRLRAAAEFSEAAVVARYREVLTAIRASGGG